VSFHNFTLLEDRCVRLLLKKLGRGMPESVVLEELESLDIRVQGITQLRSGCRDQNQAKDYTLPPASFYRWRAGLRCPKCVLSPTSADCECRWRRTWSKKAHCNESAASASDTPSVTADTGPSALRVGGCQISGWCSTPREEPQCCGCGGNHTASYRGCIKWKESRAVLARQAPERLRKSAATSHPAALKTQRPGPSAQQIDLRPGMESRPRGCVVKATTTTPQIPIQNPLLNWSRWLPSSLR